MADVTLSKAVRANLLNLQSTAELLGKTQERLATGLKVNSALDNPTNYFTASSLNSRASDLGRLLDSVSNAVQTIAAADKGLTALTKLVESAQATARQALQTAATVEANTTTVTTVASAVGNVDLRDKNANVTADAFVNDIAASIDGAVAGLVAADGSDGILSGGESFTISDGTTTHIIEFYDSSNSGTAGNDANTTYIDIYDATAYKSVADLVDDIQTALDTAGVKATLSFTDDGTDGTFNIEADSGDDTISLTAGGTDALAALGFTAGDYSGSSTALSTLATAGATLEITAGSASDTLDFTGITSVADFDAAVAALDVDGLTISSTNGVLTITADDDETTFEIKDGATAGAAAALGIEEKTYEAGNAAVEALSGKLSIKIGTNDALEIDFDSANISTQAELQALLDDLTGGTATIDASTGFLTITAAANSPDSITVSGGSGVGVADDDYDAVTTTAKATIANPKRDELRVQYNELLDQIDQLAKDSGFNGVNLLNGNNLSVLFNEDGSSKLDITGVTFDSAGLKLTTLTTGAFDDNDDINETLEALKAGIDTLRTQASKFGSNLSVVQARQEFTKNMINVLQTGASNLTLADTNEEAANLLALQTRQQLSSTALSLASQADQNVLRLF